MHVVGFGMPGQTEIILIVFVILLLFGAKKLPELSRSLGKSLGEFKKGQKEGAAPDEAVEKLEADEVKKTEKVDAEKAEPKKEDA